MSTIEKIKIQNFKYFGEEPFEFTFNKGVNIIVGKNEEGKSTILEAIHLALTSSYHGRNIKNSLSQYLFNKESVSKYLREIKVDRKYPAPAILIELWFAADADTQRYEGNYNSEEKTNVCGIKIEIKLDEEQKRSYDALLADGNLLGLPLEYYTVEWQSFARERLNSHSQKIKSVYVDSSNFHYQNAPDIFISHVVKSILTDDDERRVIQACRNAKETFSQHEGIISLNKKIKSETPSIKSDVSLDVAWGGMNDWEKFVTLKVEDVPFQQQGRGNQCILKTELALAHERAQSAPFLLLEEPESHLTFTKLNTLIKSITNIFPEKQIFITTHSSFVANKLGLERLTLLRDKKVLRLDELSSITYDFFKKIPGYDTLRMILANKCILVEGDADELIVQKAYYQTYNSSPIDDGIDIISVHTSFLRYLEVASKLGLKMAVVTDNDGDIQALEKKYADYIKANQKKGILISYSPLLSTTFTKINSKDYNDNTLEPELIRANKRSTLTKILKEKFDCSFLINDTLSEIGTKDSLTNCDDKWNQQIRTLMKNHKTESALAFFESKEKFVIPTYIKDAISFIHEA